MGDFVVGTKTFFFVYSVTRRTTMTEDRLQQRMSVYSAEQEEYRLAVAAETERNRQLIFQSLRDRIDDAIVRSRYYKTRTAYIAINRECNEYMLELATEYSAANISIACSWWNWIDHPQTIFGYISSWWVISW